jgi:putative Holliday junction resolvase
VVGLPLNLNSKVTAAAESAIQETEQLRAVLEVPVHLHDERLTTKTADRSLMELEMKADARRRVVDKVAAAVMLQSFIDHRRNQQAREPQR